MVHYSMLTSINLRRWPFRFTIRYGGSAWEYSTRPDGLGIGVYRRAFGDTFLFLGSLIPRDGRLSSPPGLTDAGVTPFNDVISAVWAGLAVPPGYALEVTEGPIMALQFLLIQDGVKGVADTPGGLNWDDIDDCAGFSVALGDGHEVIAKVAEVDPLQPDAEAWRVTSVMDGNNRLVGGYETPGPFVKTRLTAIWRAGWYFTNPPCLTIRVA